MRQAKHKHTICLRGSVTTTYVPAPHLEEISTITIRFGSRNFYTFGLQAYRKLSHNKHYAIILYTLSVGT